MHDGDPYQGQSSLSEPDLTAMDALISTNAKSADPEGSTTTEVGISSPAIAGTRMLLTSAGLTNPGIVAQLAGLLQKAFSQSRIVVVTTAASGDSSNHDWLLDDLNRLHSLGWSSFRTIDLNGPPTRWTVDAMAASDVIYFCGGNAYHLAHSIQTQNLGEPLRQLMMSKVFAGGSAGSMVFAVDFTQNLTALFGDDDAIYQARGKQDVSPFNVLPWFVWPHAAKNLSLQNGVLARTPVLAIDDDTAISISGSRTTVVSRGWWKLFT